MNSYIQREIKILPTAFEVLLMASVGEVGRVSATLPYSRLSSTFAKTAYIFAEFCSLKLMINRYVFIREKTMVRKQDFPVA